MSNIYEQKNNEVDAKRAAFRDVMNVADNDLEHVEMQCLIRKVSPLAIKEFNAFAKDAKLAHGRDIIYRFDQGGDGTMSYAYVSLADFNNMVAYFSKHYENIPPIVRQVFGDMTYVAHAAPEGIHLSYYVPKESATIQDSVKLSQEMLANEELKGTRKLYLFKDVPNPHKNKEPHFKIQMNYEEYMAIQGMRASRLDDTKAAMPFVMTIHGLKNFNAVEFSEGRDPIQGRTNHSELAERLGKETDRRLS